MKKIFRISVLGLAAYAAVCLTSCRDDDDFTESIFDTSVSVVDTLADTYPFDLWLYENFLKPYNVDITYRMNFMASDMNYQLIPADYKKSQMLAHLIKYLFYDAYGQQAGTEFLRQYGPRMFHFIGSKGYNSTTGTEILGTASGGIKVTLYGVNDLKVTDDWTAADIHFANHYFFHTMHHEFSHILHQTKVFPVTYSQVTPATYEAYKWGERDSVLAHSMGYVTNYASESGTEDFVELLSSIITDTDDWWMTRIVNSCLGGVREGDKELLYAFIDSLGIDIDKPGARWNNIEVQEEYLTDGSSMGVNRYVTRWLFNDPQRPTDGVRYAPYGKYDSFRDYMDRYVKVVTNDTVAGADALLKKLEIATTWYTDEWGLNIYDMRREVARRQENINAYIRDSITLYELEDVLLTDEEDEQ